jgi:hypothetical protein
MLLFAADAQTPRSPATDRRDSSITLPPVRSKLARQSRSRRIANCNPKRKVARAQLSLQPIQVAEPRHFGLFETRR